MDDRVAPRRAFDTRALVTLSSQASETAEAIRGLRTHIMARHVREGHRALAICAASEGVGCSFVATNLAVSLSQIGVNTLLIDANMRNPSIAAIFGHKEHGADIRAALASDLDFDACIDADILPSLSVLFSMGSAANAQELLASNRFEALMHFCLREYDATIIDTPPANVCSDVRRVSTVVGYSLIVTRRNKSLVNDVKILTEQLRGDHAEVIGSVLNEA
ncbi:MAG: CpsD/CapB family tyrosine-protein kinase [Pseudomonadota bacterium]